jgi:hypothetical protein
MSAESPKLDRANHLLNGFAELGPEHTPIRQFNWKYR